MAKCIVFLMALCGLLLVCAPVVAAESACSGSHLAVYEAKAQTFSVETPSGEVYAWQKLQGGNEIHHCWCVLGLVCSEVVESGGPGGITYDWVEDRGCLWVFQTNHWVCQEDPAWFEPDCIPDHID